MSLRSINTLWKASPARHFNVAPPFRRAGGCRQGVGQVRRRQPAATNSAVLRFTRSSVFRHDDGQPFSLHDAGALTNTLAFAPNGEVLVSRVKQTPSHTDARDFSTMLHGVRLNTSRHAAFRLSIEGAASYVLVECSSPGEIDRSAGAVTLWLPDQLRRLDRVAAPYSG